MSAPILTVRLETERDLVAARQRARQVAAHIGFDLQDQTRIATAVSEIARNAVMYAGGGRVDFALENDSAPQSLLIEVSDKGPGIEDLNSILKGRYRSQTGMGLGMQGTQRLVDDFKVQTSRGQGTTVTLRKALPRRAPALRPEDLSRIAGSLVAEGAEDPMAEIQSQNRELMRTLEELNHRSEELSHVNRELEDTNRGVVALYAELDEKAEHLRRADQLKSTFLSHMSHEFRTPLNSIMALSRILMSRMDGLLTPEQEKQVGFINRAAQELTDMVNDLLDLAKVEAGKIELHSGVWKLNTLLGTLRGMMRPLLLNSPVQLIVEDADNVPDLVTDESKVAQILRNFISNAIKFTDTGEIRVVSSYDAVFETVSISVSDTGMGIAPEDQGRIFEQFVQVDSPRQRRLKGTGLGLPLSKQLAGLLGGGITLQSQPGQGSTFTLTIPIRIPAGAVRAATAGESALQGSSGSPGQTDRTPTLLIIDDEELARYLVRKQLAGLSVEICEARSGSQGIQLAIERRPDLIILDLVMPGMSGFEVLDQLRSTPETRDIPVIVHTSRAIGMAERDRLSVRAAAVVGKSQAGAGDLRRSVAELMNLGTM